MTTPVAIAGAGPNGLMLACELGLAGVRPVVVERLAEPSREARANAIVGQAVRLLDHRGLYRRLGDVSGPPEPMPAFVFGGLTLDLSRLDNSNPMYGLGTPQRRLERLLEQRALELGVEIRRGHELAALSQRDDAVVLQLRGPEGGYEMRTSYLVGCDGGRSTVRKQAGIAFPGVTATDVVSRLAHVVVPGSRIVMPELEVPGLARIGLYAWHRTERGAYAIMPLDSGALSVSSIEWGGDQVDDDAPMTIEELRASLRRVLGADVPMTAPETRGPHLLRRLTGRNTRLAEKYRSGRVLLVGDAAHVHSGVGAPALNLGLQDAANLGWKLAAQLHGWAPSGLLDTYETERRPAAERVAMHTQAQTALLAPGGDVTALRALFAELLQDSAAVQRVADLMAGADVDYPVPTSVAEPAHPLAGQFVPDLPSVTRAGATALAGHLRDARPLLLDLTGEHDLDAVAPGWKDRVAVATAHCPAPPATALLVRPDGYVAWAATSGEPTEQLRDSLEQALARWFGGRLPPAA